MAILWSISAIGVVFFIIGELPRFLARRWLAPRNYKYATELISAFQFSACVFEIAVIGRYYSPNIAIICSFCLIFLKNAEYIFDGSCAGNPCALLEGIVCKLKKPWFIDFIVTVGLQFAGALFAFPVMRLAWKLTSSELHFKQLSDGLSTTLQIPIMAGFAIEVVTTFIVTLVDLLTRGDWSIKFNPLLRTSSCICMALALTGTTGVWMSPVLATVHTFLFTSGTELLLEHLFVFWVGPIIGTLIAIALDAKFHQVHLPPKPKPIAKTIMKKMRKRSSNGVLLKQKSSKKPKKMNNDRKTA